MALPYTIPGRAEFKKEYCFTWKLELNKDFDSNVDASEGLPFHTWKSKTTIIRKSTPENPNAYFQLGLAKEWSMDSIFDDRTVNYICQLCESVDVPDDEFETEEISVGPAVYKMPVRVLMPDISVTYLEDTLNSVYNFHKAWFSMLRKDGIQSPFKYCAKGTYITYDKTLDQLKAAAIRNFGTNAINAAASSLVNVGIDIPGIFNMDINPTGSTVYNCIYPTKISRGTGNKSGTGLAKTTVTYARLPNIPITPGNYYDKVASANEDVNTQLTDKPSTT